MIDVSLPTYTKKSISEGPSVLNHSFKAKRKITTRTTLT